MILTDDERTKIAHETGVLPSGVGDRELCELMFAAAIEREVLRKLLEVGPVAWIYTSPAFKAKQVFIDEPPPGLRKQCEPLFTIPEDQT
jgi:hypothetical protein